MHCAQRSVQYSGGSIATIRRKNLKLCAKFPLSTIPGIITPNIKLVPKRRNLGSHSMGEVKKSYRKLLAFYQYNFFLISH